MTDVRKKVIVFGASSFAEIVDFYLMKSGKYDVVAFTHTGDAGTYLERPLVPFDQVANLYTPQDHLMFVAVGYKKMNELRHQFCATAENMGYELLTYVDESVKIYKENTVIGKNVFIFEDNTVQPFSSIGDGTVLWSGNHIGHHTSIGEYCFITSHVVISGHCKVGDNCFIGVNATISDGVHIGCRNLIGPTALVQKQTDDDAVYVAERAKKINVKSERFF